MYSGSTLTRASGRVFGAHQKIDRMAKKQLNDLLKDRTQFPGISMILHFEGCNGPDAIKRKSPARDEPWHYFQPFNNDDTELLDIIKSHYIRLVESLKQKDEVRSAFEAAWLSHAIVDGLTPAHHYPYGEKVIELRGGESLESRVSIKKKIMMPGSTILDVLTNNWKFWGPKGLFMTHAAFELGVATIIKPLKYGKRKCNAGELNFDLNSHNIKHWYRGIAQEVAKMNIYDNFYQKGWTRELAREVRNQLLPIIINAVTLTWRAAINEAYVE